MRLREVPRGLVFAHERVFNMSWLGWTPLIPSLVHISVPCSLSVFSYLVEARAVGTGDSRCPTLLGLEHLRLQVTSTHPFIHIVPSLSVTGTPALCAAFVDALTGKHLSREARHLQPGWGDNKSHSGSFGA